MRVLLTGGTGQLGAALVQVLAETQKVEDIITPPRASLDIGQVGQIYPVVRKIRPDVVINCAAWTNVDSAESYPERARLVNAVGPAALASSCREVGAVLMHISTDYIFSGPSSSPWGEDDAPAALNAYGRSKNEGEEEVRRTLPDGHLIVRSSWLYGTGRNSFVYRIAERLGLGQPVRVVTDEIGSPTYTVDAAQRMTQLLSKFLDGAIPAGSYHAANTGQVSRYDLARTIASLMSCDDSLVRPCMARDVSRLAARPMYSVLGDQKARQLGLAAMRQWDDALQAAFPELRELWFASV